MIELASIATVTTYPHSPMRQRSKHFLYTNIFPFKFVRERRRMFYRQ
jgi:hypothetical protein